MTDRILPPLSADQRKIVRKEVLRFNHRLADTGLFTDAALAALIDRLPHAAITVSTLRPDRSPREAWIAGTAGTLTGAALLKAAREHPLRLRLDGAMAGDAELRAVFERMIRDFDAATGLTPLTADAAIVITSPRLAAPMSLEAGENVTWRVRGGGAFYVYPPGPDAALPWTPARENTVTPVTLHPGQGVFPPPLSPCRFVNGEELNVSVALRLDTPRSRLTQLLDRALGRPSSTAVAEPDRTPRFDLTGRRLVWRDGMAPDWARARPARKAARSGAGTRKAA